VHPKKRNQAGKPGNPDHDATIDSKLRPLAEAEFPNDIIVTGRNIKHYPGKTKGVSAEPDLMVVDAQTGQVKKVYEAARTEADGVTFKLRERNKETKYQMIGIPYNFDPVR
jgi:hypothetical protein